MNIKNIGTHNCANQNLSFKGWLTYTNTQGVKKMINTDMIQNVESKKIIYILKDKKFTGNYIFDAVKILLKGDNRCIQNEIKNIKGKINTEGHSATVGYKNYNNDLSVFNTNSVSESKVHLSSNKHSESIVLDKVDTVLIKFEDFTKEFSKALNNGFVELKSKILPNENIFKKDFFKHVDEHLPTKYAKTQEKFWIGASFGWGYKDTYHIDDVPDLKTISKEMSGFDKKLKKAYGKTLEINYENDCPAENENYYKALEIIEK